LRSLSLPGSLQFFHRRPERPEHRVALAAVIHFDFAHMKQLREIRQQRHTDFALQMISFLDLFHAGDVLPH
jgi:hypothetical protein